MHPSLSSESVSLELNLGMWRPPQVAATSAAPPLLSLVEGLLGGPLQRPARNRGIYSIFPRQGLQGGPTEMLAPHLDQVPMELGGVVYLAPVSGWSKCQGGGRKTAGDRHRKNKDR